MILAFILLYAVQIPCPPPPKKKKFLCKRKRQAMWFDHGDPVNHVFLNQASSLKTTEIWITYQRRASLACSLWSHSSDIHMYWFRDCMWIFNLLFKVEQYLIWKLVKRAPRWPFKFSLWPHYNPKGFSGQDWKLLCRLLLSLPANHFTLQ